MPVLIEGVSVLLRKGSIHERYKGGYAQFLFDLNDYVSFTASNQLLCAAYKTHDEARALLKMLESSKRPGAKCPKCTYKIFISRRCLDQSQPTCANDMEEVRGGGII